MDTQAVDAVQIFDVDKALASRTSRGRIDMALSPNCYIGVFQTAPRGGETHVHSHPDSDQILFILKGECTVEGLDGRYTLTPNQGALIPAGVNYGFTNTTTEDLIFLSIRTEASGGRRVAYVPNVESGIKLRVPADALSASGGPGRHMYLYAMDRRTIGVSHLLIEDWNKGSLLRMHSSYERSGDEIVVDVPERLARWYQLQGLTDAGYTVQAETEQRGAKVDITPFINQA